VNEALETISSDQPQRDQALNVCESFIVQAPAGSGKTELLAQRYLSLLGQAEQPESILAMTFTNKAADELKHRVMQYLHDASLTPPNEPHQLKTYELANKAISHSNQQGWNLLGNPSRIKISTIDSLSSLIVSKYPSVENLIAPRVLAHSYEHELYYQNAAENTFKLLEDKEYQGPISRVLLHLDNYVEGFYRLLVQMLAKREQWLPRLYQQGVLEIDVLDRTAKGIIGEHLLRLQALAKSVFDDSFFAPLNDNDLVVSELPEANVDSLNAWTGLAKLCITAKGQWRKTVNIKQGFDVKAKEQKQAFIDTLESLQSEEELRALLYELTHLPEPNYQESERQMLLDISEVLKLGVAQLQLLFQASNVVDFAEVGLRAADKLDDLEGVSDVALFLDYKIEHLLIDEFQDTSFAQFSLIEKLLSSWQDDSGKTVFLVGDPMQSIYRFRESEVGIFLQVKESGISNVRPKYLQLNRNFRSIGSIINNNNHFFSTIFPNKDSIENGAIHYSPSFINSEDEIDEVVYYYPLLSGMEQQEARQVSKIISKALDENDSDEIAVLVRSRSHLNEIIKILRLKGIAYEAVRTTALSSHLFTRDLLCLTRAMLSLGDKLAWLALLRSPWCGLLLKDLLKISQTDATTIYHQLNDSKVVEFLSEDANNQIEKLRSILAEAIENDGRFSFVERFSCALNHLSPHASLDEEQRSIKSQFLTILYECESLDKLALDHIEAMLSELYAPSQSARLKLMTIHQAKGLEFDVVIMPGLGKSGRPDTSPLIRFRALVNNQLLLSPIKSAFESDEGRTYTYLKELEKKQNHFELMRLLYVAMSRAKKKIHLLGHVNAEGEAAKNTLLDFVLPFFKNSMNLPEKYPENDAQDFSLKPLLRYHLASQVEGADFNNSNELFNLSNNLALLYQSALGVVFHHYLEFEIFAPDEKSIEAKLLQLGVPSKLRASQCRQILKFLNNTKKDPAAQWLFQPRKSTQVEAEFGTEDGTIVIDRLFVDKDVLWIIDYKTASPLPDESNNSFIERMKIQHQHQLSRYEVALADIYHLPTKSAIYCPSIPQLIYL